MKSLSQRLATDAEIIVSLVQTPISHFIVSFSNYALTDTGLNYIFQSLLLYADIVERDMFGFIFPWNHNSSFDRGPSPRNPTLEFYTPLFQQFFTTLPEKSLYFQDILRNDLSFVFETPETLSKLFDFSLKTKIYSVPELFHLIDQIILYSIHQGHPHYVFQVLAAGLDPIGIIGDILPAVSPPELRDSREKGAKLARNMELEIFKNVSQLIGYPDNCGGMTCPGGSVSNMSAMTLALWRVFPHLKTSGVVGSGYHPVLFVASNAHYSFAKGAMLLGLGSKSCIPVAVDAQGRMIPSELLSAIMLAKNEGKDPFFVAVAAGTTDIGVYDR